MSGVILRSVYFYKITYILFIVGMPKKLKFEANQLENLWLYKFVPCHVTIIAIDWNVN